MKMTNSKCAYYRYWLPALLFLFLAAGYFACHCFGGVQVVWLRGFTNDPISTPDKATAIIGKAIGYRFAVIKKAFNDDTSWQMLEPVFTKPPAAATYDGLWAYHLNAGDAVLVYVKNGLVTKI